MTRGFGKSLNIDMLKTFFELGTDPALFDGLEISRDKTACRKTKGAAVIMN